MTREELETLAEAGRLSAGVDEEGRAAYEARQAPGRPLMEYQRELALRQREDEERRALRRRYAEAAGE